MISLALARRLRDGGVKWSPNSGDRFAIVDRGMDDESFVLADMTVELHKFEHGAVIGFNGTTEWALDSVDPRDSVWLPSEGQLRELLAQTFVALERDGEQWRVRYVAGPSERSATHEDAAQAYGLALLYLVTGEDVAA